MIQLKTILTLDNPFIAAASGLAIVDAKFMIAADDENFVALYDEEKKSGISIPIFPGDLPLDLHKRKKIKPDIESLVYLPDSKIMAVPSGSALNRDRGALLRGDGSKIKDLSFQNFYAELRKTFNELNIEGACVINEEVWFFQRGNGSLGENGIVKTTLVSCMDGQPTILEIQHISLGQFQGVNLSFTDVSSWNSHILFLAVAEDSKSTYLDGNVVGSFLGLMNSKGGILKIEELELTSKAEGLCAQDDNFFLVIDDDNRKLPSKLFSGTIPVEWNIDF